MKDSKVYLLIVFLSGWLLCSSVPAQKHLAIARDGLYQTIRVDGKPVWKLVSAFPFPLGPNDTVLIMIDNTGPDPKPDPPNGLDAQLDAISKDSLRGKPDADVLAILWKDARTLNQPNPVPKADIKQFIEEHSRSPAQKRAFENWCKKVEPLTTSYTPEFVGKVLASLKRVWGSEP